MSQIIKAFTGVFILLFMMVSATGILGAFVQTVHAQNLHGAIVQEMENSNYTWSVMKECFQTAEDWGYDLDIYLYLKDNRVCECKESTDLLNDTQNVAMAKVILTYPIRISFLNIDMEQMLYGYGR